MNRQIHECGGTILAGGAGEQAHKYCDRCRAFTYDLDGEVPSGCNIPTNRAAWDGGESVSPPADAPVASDERVAAILTDVSVFHGRLRRLWTEAGAAGDSKQVRLCRLALDGDGAAAEKCARVLADAEAQEAMLDD